MAVKMKLEGFSDLDKELAQFSKSVGKGVLRRTLIAASGPLAALMRQNAPRDTQALYDSIAISTKLNARQSRLHRRMFRNDKASVEVFVGAGTLPQAHLQEFGTENHSPQAFIRPAWDNDKMQLLERIKKLLRIEIDKAALRAARKAAKAG